LFGDFRRDFRRSHESTTTGSSGSSCVPDIFRLLNRLIKPLFGSGLRGSNFTLTFTPTHFAYGGWLSGSNFTLTFTPTHFANGGGSILLRSYFRIISNQSINVLLGWIAGFIPFVNPTRWRSEFRH
jgi:hypothetical protein